MNKPLKKLNYLVLLLFCIGITLYHENINIQNISGESLEQASSGWWQIGDYYTYQEINHSKVNITYTVAEEIVFNGTVAFNVTSSASERPATIMWNVSYQENQYRNTESFDLMGEKISIISNAVAYYQVYTSVENVIFLNQPKLADYREGVNLWRETSYSEVVYDQSNYEDDPHAPPLTVYSETYNDVNSTILLETSDVVVPAGHFNCWKIEYLITIFPTSSVPAAKNHSTIWNQTGITLKDGSFYSDQWKNSTQFNETHAAHEQWWDNNGTITSANYYLSFLNKRVLFIDKTLGIMVKSVDYWMGEYYHGYELNELYLASPPPPTTTSIASTASTISSTTTSQSKNTTTLSTTSTAITSASPLWIPIILLLGLWFIRKYMKSQK